MFSFFKKTVTIKSIYIPDFGWNKIEENKSSMKWVNDEETTLLSLNFFSIKPDLPTIKEIDTLRSFYRKTISKIKGGLIEVDIVSINSIAAVKTIFKIPQEETGMIYLASLTIPFEDYSFVVKIQSNEVGMTGMRDSFVLNKLLGNGEVTFANEGIENWFSDPYDPSLKDGTLMNKSEDEIYDEEFPDHPLTIARSLINEISKKIIFKPEIDDIKIFDK